jgi:hypothetical protein
MIEVDEKYRKSQSAAAAGAATRKSVRMSKQARISVEMWACFLSTNANPQTP